jgi:YjbE family integral membrane protein
VRIVDFGILGHIEFTWQFLFGLLSIVLIDLVLAGDNAVVIAMAVRNLPRKKRVKGIILGAGAAVVLRVALTFFASKLLEIMFVKFIGGVLIIWIAVKLFISGGDGEEGGKEAASLVQAMWLIIVADITMSIDNILAVAGASKGNLFLLIFGLGLSIPFVVFTSNLLSMLMDRYPVILYIGTAVLGRVGGEMMITDPFIVSKIGHSKVVEYGVQAFFIVAVIVVGKLLLMARRRRGGVEEHHIVPHRDIDTKADNRG